MSAKPRGQCPPSEAQSPCSMETESPPTLLSDVSQCHIHRKQHVFWDSHPSSPQITWHKIKLSCALKGKQSFDQKRRQSCSRERLSRAESVLREKFILPCALGVRTEICLPSGPWCCLPKGCTQTISYQPINFFSFRETWTWEPPVDLGASANASPMGWAPRRHWVVLQLFWFFFWFLCAL